ncbi:MAG: DNA polymerase III subunit gamma/tau, partial [Bacteroidales bacterium]|nr:DNA polymerase III subunit gamma/tau [Bacteroidales bacterium]
QAFLFTGPRGVGKTTCARILAKTINCENITDSTEACNQCESCTSFNDSASFNIHELDAASNNSVDDIRNLVERVRIPPQVGKYKVYIIDEVHMLSAAAFNAFLKTLEEPPPYAKFILATTEKHKIIPTILSRCQIFDFRRILVDDITDYLSYVAENENVEAEEEALHTIAQKADGALRDALSTFDQIVSFSGSKLTYKNVIENLNILDYEYYFRVTGALLNADLSNLLLIFNEIIENGFDGQHFMTGLGDHLRNLLLIKDPGTVQLMHASPSLKEKYTTQAAQCGVNWLLAALEICNKYDLSYKTSNNKRLHVEICLMQLTLTGQTAAPVQAVQKQAAVVRPGRETQTLPAQNTPQAVQKPMREDKPVYEKQQKPKLEEVKKGTEKPAHQAEKKAVVEGNGRKIKNISIKDSLNALKKNKPQEEEAAEQILTTPFDQEKLEACWKLFTASYQEKSPSFASAIAKYKPVLKDDFVIAYKVDNKIIAEDLLNVSALLQFLKKELRNNQLTLTPTFPEKNEKKTAYTDREKFEQMAKKYPDIVKLKEQLNLELGF